MQGEKCIAGVEDIVFRVPVRNTMARSSAELNAAGPWAMKRSLGLFSGSKSAILMGVRLLLWFMHRTAEGERGSELCNAGGHASPVPRHTLL